MKQKPGNSQSRKEGGMAEELGVGTDRRNVNDKVMIKNIISRLGFLSLGTIGLLLSR